MDKEEFKAEKMKDVGIVTKSPDEIFWEGIVEKASAAIKTLQDELKINEAIKEMALKKIEEAKSI